MQRKALTSLHQWFTTSKRDLPWREDPTPYKIWVSEVMLQQTQVAVVIPYFLHWMERFPSIKQLADAERDEVIKAWEGLGYYSRARNLHEGARFVVEHYGGELPNSWNELSQIKGLGPYTIGAILSFAFHKRTPAVDGNVIRVLTRYLGLEEDISKPKTQNMIREKAEQLLPSDEHWITNEALIELGATVCQKRAKCSECPLSGSCVAFKQRIVDRLPVKSVRIKYEKLHRTVTVIYRDGYYLIKRGQKGEIMNDLHEFPFFEEVIDQDKLKQHVNETMQLEIAVEEKLKEVNHSFTRYRVRLTPFMCRAKDRREIEGCRWISAEELKALAFSSGHRRIYANVLESRC